MLTDLADVLRGGGLPVTEVPGWKTRGYNGNSIYGPYGGLVHHTGTVATAKGDYPTLNTILNGRSNLPGPLAQLGLGRSGMWYVIAAGYCNHAGPVDDPDYANVRAIGVECEHPGGSTPWASVQYSSLIAGCAVLGRHYGIKWRGHKEAAIPKGRKPDPNLNMVTLRNKIAAYKPTTDELEEPMKVQFTNAYEYDKARKEGKTEKQAREIAAVTYNSAEAALAGIGSFLSALLRDVQEIKDKVGL